jgi:hypothetical protein
LGCKYRSREKRCLGSYVSVTNTERRVAWLQRNRPSQEGGDRSGDRVRAG